MGLIPAHKDKCPCTPDCPERSSICHAICERYIKWAKRHAERRERINKLRADEQALFNSSMKRGRR